MTTLLYANNAITALSSPITTSSTVISVAPGTGNLFPSPASPQSFRITLTDAATGLIYEILDCTSRSGDSMTVSRAQEGTTAHSWSAGDKVSMFPTAGTMQNLAQINGYGANGNWNINAATATTATNQSGGTVNATTINSSGNVVSGGNVTVNGGNLQVGSSAGNYVDINFTGQLSIQGGSFNQLVTVNQFGSNWAINGYQYLPNGFLIQWGQSSVHTSGIFSFPISFPNACVAMSLNDGYAGVHVMSGSAINNSQFAAYTNPNDTNFFFIALGY